ncbi:hypothetical protein JCM11641_002971 [Rhodosporidiobolus odoratus]
MSTTWRNGEAARKACRPSSTSSSRSGTRLGTLPAGLDPASRCGLPRSGSSLNGPSDGWLNGARDFFGAFSDLKVVTVEADGSGEALDSVLAALPPARLEALRIQHTGFAPLSLSGIDFLSVSRHRRPIEGTFLRFARLRNLALELPLPPSVWAKEIPSLPAFEVLTIDVRIVASFGLVLPLLLPSPSLAPSTYLPPLLVKVQTFFFRQPAHLERQPLQVQGYEVAQIYLAASKGGSTAGSKEVREANSVLRSFGWEVPYWLEGFGVPAAHTFLKEVTAFEEACGKLDQIGRRREVRLKVEAIQEGLNRHEALVKEMGRYAAALGGGKASPCEWRW